MPISASSKSGTDNKTTYKYGRDKKGNLTSLKSVYYNKYYGGKTFKKLKKTSTTTTAYKLNKKGRITKATSTTVYIDKSKNISSPLTYKYDGKGNLKSISHPYPYYTCTYSYKYSGKHAKTRTYKQKYSGGSTYGPYSTSLTYETRKVPKKYAAVVKAQQWALLNGNANRAFGPRSLGLSVNYD